MGPSVDLNTLFETVNGAWTIMLTFFIGFLIAYLYEHRIDRHMTLRQWFFGRADIGAQVAVAILIADLGNWVVRCTVWVWREMTAGRVVMADTFVIAVIIGGIIGAIGMLCKLRVFSVHRFGHAPWLSCLGVTAAFIIYKWADWLF